MRMTRRREVFFVARLDFVLQHQVQVVQKQLVSLLEKEGKSVSLKSLLDDTCPSLTASTTAPGEGEEPTGEYNKELQEGFSEESHLSLASGQERTNTTDMVKDEGASVTRSERDSPDNNPRPVDEGRQEKMLNGAGNDAVKKQNTEKQEEESQTRQSSGADTVSTAASCSCATSGSPTSLVVNEILKQVPSLCKLLYTGAPERRWVAGALASLGEAHPDRSATDLALTLSRVRVFVLTRTSLL